MAWERRQRGAGRRYYYRSVRIGHRVVKLYVGTGHAAELAAAADAQAKARRDADRDQVRRAEIEMAAAEAAIQELDAVTTMLAQATLFCAGFHFVNYMWRKRRAGRFEHNDEGEY
jgi:hypothetical protein